MVLKFKYPSTPHLPCSQSVQFDDFIIAPQDLEFLQSGVELIVTEKMDGGNVSLYRDRFHARSLDSTSNPWEDRTKAEWAARSYLIPENVRISGESLYTRKSVAYENLPASTMVFGAWEDDTLLDWDSGVELAEKVMLPTVPLLYRGADFHEAINAWKNSGRSEDTSEGFVVRYAGKIKHDDFSGRIAKWVRKNHIQTSDDWRKHNDHEHNGINPVFDF